MNSQYRCETCDYRCDKKDGIKCPYDKEDVYYLLKEEMSFPRGSWLFTSVVGCASHSDFQNQREKQCGTCKHKGTRACSHHGYDDVPISCSYKLGIYAEEAMKNLNGTFIDVWTPEHDKQVIEKVLDIISKGKSAINKRAFDGFISGIDAEKLDLLYWIETELWQEGKVEK